MPLLRLSTRVSAGPGRTREESLSPSGESPGSADLRGKQERELRAPSCGTDCAGVRSVYTIQCCTHHTVPYRLGTAGQTTLRAAVHTVSCPKGCTALYKLHCILLYLPHPAVHTARCCIDCTRRAAVRTACCHTGCIRLT